MSSPVPPSAHRLVTELFLQALEMEAAAREAWLARVAAERPAQVDDVRHLLDAHDHAAGFLAVDDDGLDGPPAARVGQTVGPFTIEREIGHGGMGTVYLARRDGAGYSQQVALKLLSPHGGGAAAARLRDERRILAGLNHPNIAHFVDGGATDDGLPFIAMEYVDGQPITTHCAAAGLDVPARLRLFLRVSAAVHFAHQHLVVHRDIKPSNILVTADGTPKLLDFGIAKLLDAVDPATAAGTLRVLTPHYASPEQVRGEPVTTASDVYSLGVLLFELLTGRGPYGEITPDSGPLAVMDAIRDAAPERPGAVAPAALRIGRDLDAIVLKALRKDPGERYGSAEQFALDVTRYLDGLPVDARRGSTAYRLQRLARRHWAGVTAAVVVVVALAVAAGVSMRQAGLAREAQARAESRFNDVRALANAFVFEFDDAVREVPGTTAARRLVIDRSLRYLERLAADARGDAALDREIAAAYLRIGDVQGNPYEPNLGDRGAAMTSYRRALALRERLAASPGATVEDRLAMAAALDAVGELQWASGDFTGALDQHQRSQRTVAAMAAASPGNADLAYRSAAAAYRVAQSLTKLGRFDEAVRHYEQSVAIFDHPALPATPSASQQATRAVAVMKVGDGQLRRGEVAAALASYQQAVQVLEALSARDAGNAGLHRRLAFVLHRMAAAHAVAGDVAAAEAGIGRALTMLRGPENADPGNRQGASDIAAAESTLAAIVLLAGRAADARDAAADAVRRYDALAAAGAGYVDQRSEHAVALRRAGDAAAATGNRDAARTFYARAIALLDEVPRDGEYASERALVHLRASSVAASPADAATLRREALAAWDAVRSTGVATCVWEFGSPRRLAEAMTAARASAR